MSLYRVSTAGVPTTNSNAAFQALLDTIETTGGTLIVDQQVQLTGTTGVVYESDKDLTVIFEGNGVIDATNLTGALGSAAWAFRGTYHGSFSLTSTLDEGSFTCPVSPAQESVINANLDEKNVLIIVSNNGKHGNHSGEMQQVFGSTGGIAQLGSRTRDTYQVGGSNTVSVLLTRCPRIKIIGLKLYRNPLDQLSVGQSRTGLELRYVLTPTLEECFVYGCKYINILLLYSYGGLVKNCTADSGLGGLGSDSMNYGFGVGPAEDVLLLGCLSMRCKHALSLSGNQQVYNFTAKNCRFITLAENTSALAVRTHSSTADATFENCYVFPCLSHTGTNLTIRGGLFYGNQSVSSAPISISPQNPGVLNNVLIDGAKFFYGTTSGGIYIGDGAVGVNYGNVIIQNCFSQYTNATGYSPIRLSLVYGPGRIRNFVLENNFISFNANHPVNIAHGSGTKLWTFDRVKISGYYEHAGTSGIPRTFPAGAVQYFSNESDAVYILNSAKWVHDQLNVTSDTTLNQQQNKFLIRLNSSSPLTITLPDAIGSKARFRILVAVKPANGSHKIVCGNTTNRIVGKLDVAFGEPIGETNPSTWLERRFANCNFYSNSTTTEISLNGTSSGGLVGDFIELEDSETGKWHVINAYLRCEAGMFPIKPFN